MSYYVSPVGYVASNKLHIECTTIFNGLSNSEKLIYLSSKSTEGFFI